MVNYYFTYLTRDRVSEIVIYMVNYYFTYLTRDRVSADRGLWCLDPEAEITARDSQKSAPWFTYYI